MDKDTELFIKDVVLFNNPKIGTDMHRIVDIEYRGDEVQLANWKVDKYHNNDIFMMFSIEGSIKIDKPIMFNNIEIVTYSDTPYDIDEYHYRVNSTQINDKLVVESTLIDGAYYHNKITYHTDSLIPSTFSLTKKSYDIISHFSYIKLYGDTKEYLIDHTIFNGYKFQTYLFYKYPVYMIREMPRILMMGGLLKIKSIHVYTL